MKTGFDSQNPSAAHDGHSFAYFAESTQGIVVVVVAVAVVVVVGGQMPQVKGQKLTKCTIFPIGLVGEHKSGRPAHPPSILKPRLAAIKARLSSSLTTPLKQAGVVVVVFVLVVFVVVVVVIVVVVWVTVVVLVVVADVVVVVVEVLVVEVIVVEVTVDEVIVVEVAVDVVVVAVVVHTPVLSSRIVDRSNALVFSNVNESPKMPT